MNNKKYGICKLCDNYCRFVKSHIIPIAFYKNPIITGDRLNKVFSELECKTEPRQNGIFEYFLCVECENRFQKCDNLAYKLFYERSVQSYTFLKNTDYSFLEIKLSTNDVKLLKLFFISLLWRAQASGRKEFKSVQLGKYMENAKLSIIKEDPSYFQEIDIAFSKFKKINPERELAFLFPIKQKFTDCFGNSVNGYRICFPLYTCFIKVDQKPFPKELNQCSIETLNAMVIIERDWKNSNEFLAVNNMIFNCNKKSLYIN